MNHGLSIKNNALIITLPDGADIDRVEVNGKMYTIPSGDCVDRREAIKKMARAIWLYPNELYPTLRHYQNAKDLAEYGLKDVPSAESKIIRCKDCENWDTTWQNDWAKNYHYCPLIDGTRKGDWYCADAERRTDE